MNIIKTFAIATAVCSAFSMSAKTQKTTQQTVELDSLSLAVATSMTQSINKSIEGMQKIGFEIDHDAFVKALNLALNGENTGFTPESADKFLDEYLRKAHQIVPQSVSTESQLEYLDKMAQETGAVRMPSGIIFTTIEEGTGAYPTDADKVSVECYSVLSDNSVFYETEEGKPDDYDVTGVIKGFAEGLKMMRVGGKYRVVIPAELAYGEKGINGVVPGNAALNFTVKLIAISPKDTPQEDKQ